MTSHREAIIAEALSWIGTPYHHQASLKGVGADCLGVVRGVWRSVHGYDAEMPPAYSRDWAEAAGEETLLAAAGRHMRPIGIDQRQPGDVLIFRFRATVPAKHAGILTGPDTFVHAIEGGAACDVALSAWWRRRIAGVFAFYE